MPASLTSTPVTRQPISCARNRAGPPEPQPTSRTWSAAASSRSRKNRRYSGAGDPAALAEVFAVGLAAHLLQGMRGEVAVGRAIQVHRLGHEFLRDVATADVVMSYCGKVAHFADQESIVGRDDDILPAVTIRFAEYVVK